MEFKHKRLIQYLMEKGGVALEKVLKDFKNEITTIKELKADINQINNLIKKQYFKIAIANCELTDKEVVCWLNTKSDNIAKHRSTYSALELEYFHVLLQEVISSDDKRLNYSYAINLTSRLTSSISREKAQNILYKWFKIQYFIKKDEFIYAGPRLILEFTSYLKSQLPDHICNLCSELVLRTKMCSNCNEIFHTYCLKKYLAKQHKCPSCMKTWAEETQDITNKQNSSDQMEVETPRSSKYRRVRNS
ncbi:SMC5-SMC6 complex component Non-SMC element 1 [Rhynchophorus ferrugineus]|uniref:SMC5-SMC6 complex component Non-SMC element 1 n=1 Tax=Rhynchophorus ferrugineus TaxID=354439 RepID=UPI003FCCC536